jgi:hypothetical protein
MTRVFLSYQKRDRDLAERMAAALKAEGVSVWWDDDLTPRESWDRTIEREIAAADHVLVLWTANSVESDWVRIEGNYARNCTPSKLIQARFDHAAIPIAFSMIQYVDLQRDRLKAGQGWQRLLSWISDEPVSTPTGPAPAQDGPRVSGVMGMGAIRSLDPRLDPAAIEAFKWLALGHLLYLAGLYASAVMGLTVEAAWLTPLFGLPWLVTRALDRQWFAPLLFVIAISVIHHYAQKIAVDNYVGNSNFIPGALGGAFGGACSLLAAWLLRLLRPGRYLVLPVAVATLALTAIGSLGVYFYLLKAGPHPGPQPPPPTGFEAVFVMMRIYTPWQIAFAYFLARLTKPAVSK